MLVRALSGSGGGGGNLTLIDSGVTSATSIISNTDIADAKAVVAYGTTLASSGWLASAIYDGSNWHTVDGRSMSVVTNDASGKIKIANSDGVNTTWEIYG